MSEIPDCLICRKHRDQALVPGGPIYKDDLVFASHALGSAGGRPYLGWCLVEPLRHAPGLGDLTDAEAKATGWLVARLSRALQEELEAEHVYAFVLGHHVPHLHIHLIPRYPGTPREYWGTRIDEWPDAPRGDDRKLADVVARLRAQLVGA